MSTSVTNNSTNRIALGFALIFILLWLAAAIFPFLWTLWGSFKVQGDFFSKADWTYAIGGVRTIAETGSPFTGNGYIGAWIEQDFWRAALNTSIVTFFVVIISLTFGTLGGYALARSGFKYAIWILIIGLVFRAMPHITLVSGYLLPFFEFNVWGRLSTTIVVLVAINQPFTIWMLHSFFVNIPKELDESAMVDGCTRFQAFRHVIVPVMWPGVITTGLFSFLLALLIGQFSDPVERFNMRSAVFANSVRKKHVDHLNARGPPIVPKKFPSSTNRTQRPIRQKAYGGYVAGNSTY